MNPSIYVSIPTLGHMHPAFVNAFYQHAQCAALQGIVLQIAYKIGDSVIMRARSQAISEFYFSTAHTHYFHISDDIEIAPPATPEDNVFSRLLAHDKDFIGVLYSRTSFPEQCTSVALDGSAVVGADRGLVPVKYLSGGIWLLRRSVASKLMAAHPELKYSADGDVAERGKPTYALFLESLQERPDGTRKLLTEDYAFCERWRALGGEIWADTSVRTRHYGPHGYSLK